MVSFISASNHFSFFSSETRPKLPALAFMTHPRRQHSVSFDLLVANGSVDLGFSGSVKRRSLGNVVISFHGSSCSGLAQRKRRSEGCEAAGDPVLEAEILEFMEKSENPNAFPSKKELIEAGRMDLVEGIVKQGGWLSLGWDVDEEEESVVEDRVQVRDLNSVSAEDADDTYFERDSRIFQLRFDGDSGNDVSTSASYPPSSSGRGVKVEDDAGIEGILSRLEKERSQSFGIGSREKQSEFHVLMSDNQDDLPLEISADSDNMGGMFKPDMWRKWSTQRAGFSKSEFEAAEIGEHFATNDEITPKEANNMRYMIEAELKFGDKEKDSKQIRSRLQNLESQLNSVLHVLRSRSDIIVSDKDNASPLEELHKLSDTWEFQETEIMNARDKLRSIRAKLSVLEGKMSLAIIEAQKMVELRQKRINDAQKALSLLRTACMVWPNPASEVLLSGSFDGWTSQRRMDRSRSGIFSLYLKLYPGQYEVKFIVDGVWMIDPLRPIVHNNGYENNLIVVS